MDATPPRVAELVQVETSLLRSRWLQTGVAVVGSTALALVCYLVVSAVTYGNATAMRWLESSASDIRSVLTPLLIAAVSYLVGLLRQTPTWASGGSTTPQA